VCEGTDGKAVHARFRHRFDRFQPQAPASLQAHRWVPPSQDHGSAQVRNPHVVEQDQFGTCGQSIADLFQVVAFDLKRQMGSGGAHGPDRRPDPVGPRDMVVLHQRGVSKSLAVVRSTAAAHRVLLQQAQPGRGLAGVT
jgi:hypothetical protein